MAISRPEVFVIENVPGMKKFPIVMEAMTKMPDYYVTAFCPIKSQDWLPQNRNRLIIFGSKKPFLWSEPTVSHRTKLRDIVEQDPDTSTAPTKESQYQRVISQLHSIQIDLAASLYLDIPDRSFQDLGDKHS